MTAAVEAFMDWAALFRIDEFPEELRGQVPLAGWLAFFQDRLEAQQQGRPPSPPSKFVAGKQRRRVAWPHFFSVDEIPEARRMGMVWADWEKHFQDKYQRLEKAEKQLSALRKSLEKQPDSVAARAELGEALELTGALEEAARLFNENARALDGDGFFLKALRFAERSIRCVEYQPEAWMRLGSLRESLGHFADADLAYRRLLQMAQARKDEATIQRCQAARVLVKAALGDG
jgi:tetratricopeptide (TPR) repeat protein